MSTDFKTTPTVNGSPLLRSRAAIVTTSTYTVVAGQTTAFDTTSNAITATLPLANSVPAGVVVVLKVILPVVTGTLTNSVTYQCAGSDKINRTTGATPATSGTLVYQGQAVLLESDGTSIWTILADDLPLTQLDTRFASLTSVASLSKILAGTTIPTNSLDRWKAGRSLQATRLAVAVTNAATAIAVADPAIAPTSLHRRFTLDIAPNAEEIFTTAGEGALTLTGVTSVATTGIFTKTAHGLVAGQMVMPTNNVLNSFLTVFTVYYVSATNLAANTFSLAATSGGSVLTGTTNDTNLVIALSQLTVTTRGNVNGSAAVAHAVNAPLFATKVKTVFHAGDSVVDGSDSAALADDGWTIRTARSMSDRMGGLVAQSWPYWRSFPAAHREYSSVTNGGTILQATNNAGDCGWGGAINQAGVATTGSVITWTRPAGVRVLALDFRFVDYGANATGFSYQVVDKNGVAGAWTNCPFSSIFSSGKGILRRLRIAVDDPVSFSWRSCNAAGTSKTVVFPFIPITTWAAYPSDQITEGVHWVNAGWAGKLLSGVLNARVVHDAVTDGSGGLTSATAAFVANDVSQYCFVNGTQTTIATRTNGTTATTAAALPAGTGQRLTILQGSATGDWMADFYGHHGSLFPDLVILGPFDNDLPNNEPDMYGDMFQWLITQIQPCADILLIAPYEFSSSASSGVQASYRAVLHTIAATNNVAILDLYDFLVAYGITGYSGMVTAGLLADLIHLNQKGNTMVGAQFTRVLSEL